MPSKHAGRRTIAMLGVTAGLALAAATARGQDAGPGIVHVSFVQTTWSFVPGRRDVRTEQGTISIAPDGRYRIGRVRNGVASAEIIDLAKRRRVMLDFEKRTAVSGTTMTVPVVPGSRERPIVGSGLPHAEQLDRSTVSLGTKVVDGLVLEGTRETIASRRISDRSVIVDTAEMWVYRFGDAGLVLLEHRFAGENYVNERRIVAISRTPASDDLFTVPVGFTIVDSPR